MRITNLALIATTLVLGSAPVALAGQAQKEDSSIIATIASFNGPWWVESLPNFEALYRNPSRAVELLIGSLRTSPSGKYGREHHPPTVWSIRALSSLTGLEFTAKSRRRITYDDMDSLPLPDSTGQIAFFE